jgi:hypothetical protein
MPRDPGSIPPSGPLKAQPAPNLTGCWNTKAVAGTAAQFVPTKPAVRLSDLTQPQRGVVLALIQASRAAEASSAPGAPTPAAAELSVAVQIETGCTR